MALRLIYVGSHDEAIKHGSMVRKKAAFYTGAADIENRLAAFFRGDDSTFHFTSVTAEEFEDSLADK